MTTRRELVAVITYTTAPLDVWGQTSGMNEQAESRRKSNSNKQLWLSLLLIHGNKTVNCDVDLHHWIWTTSLMEF